MKSKKSSNTDIDQILELDRKYGRRRSKRWIITIIVLVLAVIAIYVFQNKNGQNMPKYETQQVKKGNLTIIVTATGTLQPTNEVEVGSEESGIVDNVDADYNDKVTVGQVLARLDTSRLDSQITQAKASLEVAKANVLQAQATLNETSSKLEQYKKVRQLSDNKVPSQTELDAAQAAFERAKANEASAKASILQAQAALDTLETDRSKTVIHSPINGVVLTRAVEPGQTVAAAFQAPVLFTLAEDLTQMELHVDVDEADIGQVKEGQDAVFTVDAYPNREFEAKIIQIRYGSQTIEGVVTYETVLKVDNSDLSLRPGMTATAEITVSKVEDAILIPNNALRFTPPEPEQQQGQGRPRSLLGAIMPRPPMTETKRTEETDNKIEKEVWTLVDNELSPINIITGESDGIMTEVIKGDIKPGTELVTNTLMSQRR
ncbi:MAG: efflux RND transporter periplasmic adaptor subunit [Sedimentisphaerales bacterium]|nr:efflux RND transporter periplasmic adaptor subunit [Sedimentisphaerales bacterium]